MVVVGGGGRGGGRVLGRLDKYVVADDRVFLLVGFMWCCNKVQRCMHGMHVSVEIVLFHWGSSLTPQHKRTGAWPLVIITPALQSPRFEDASAAHPSLHAAFPAQRGP